MWLSNWYDERTPQQQEQDRDQLRERRLNDPYANRDNGRQGQQNGGSDRLDGGRLSSL
ncbi:MAG: hypothetical protein ACJ73S_29515 [Mycobacteriales bacterium]